MGKERKRQGQQNSGEWSEITIAATVHLADRMRRLSRYIEVNSLGLPEGYWDPQAVAALDEEELDEQRPYQSLAWVTLDYSEGFPTVNGVPFWERLHGEPLHCYRVFKHYRDSLEVRGVRSLADTARATGTPIAVAQALVHLYYWYPRVRAYDLYREMERESVRRHHIIKMHNEHWDMAEELIERIRKYLSERFEEFPPGVVLELLKQVVALQRASVGLPPSGADKGQPGVVLNLNQTTQVTQSQEQNVTVLAAALQDPETVRLAEELALRLYTPGPSTAGAR